MASGAAAVRIERPALYGACAAGESDAGRMVKILRDELARTLILCGLPDIASIGPELLS